MAIDQIKINSTAYDIGASASNISFNKNGTSLDATNVQSAIVEIDGDVSALGSNKVDKVTGKGLSTNDFTDAAQTKLSGIETGAQVNTITGVKGGAEQDYRIGNVSISKADIGLANVDNTSDVNKPISTATQNALNNKVDKVTGKGLSTNDYTTAEKEKLDTVSEYANHVNVTRYGTEGTKIATISCDGIDTDIYADGGSGPSNAMIKGVDYVTAGQLEGSTLGTKATAEGWYTVASGWESHAEGYRTTASGAFSHAEGEETSATGQWAHGEGEQTSAFGHASHSEGAGTEASGNASHAEGSGTYAKGQYSHAEGIYTSASGQAAHAEGGSTTADGSCAHSQGQGTKALGTNSHAEGFYTSANGSGSHAEGQYTCAASDYQHVEGKYNIVDTSNTYAHIIGNGTSAVRSNAFTVSWDGDVTAGRSTGIENSNKLVTGADIYSAGLALIDYSTSEQNTGIKWIDGKDIYQKTIVKDSGFTSGVDIQVTHGIDNIDSVIDYKGIFIETSGYSTNMTQPVSSATSPTASVNAAYAAYVNFVGKTDILYTLGSVIVNQVSKLYVTIYYTKTTTT